MIETAPAPIETVTPMKQSEALRLGCLIAPNQLTDAFFDQRHESACAYGAMALGFGHGWNLKAADSLFIGDAMDYRFCPNERCGAVTGSMPAHLNDFHGWPREKIADWLETQGL
jgi:hypothetical protein